MIRSTKALLGDSRVLNHGLIAYYLTTYATTTVLVLHTSLSLPGSFPYFTFA